jgi:putative glutamine amidotransferase
LSMKKPIIGVTPSPVDDAYLESTFNVDYTEAIEAAGGIPVILQLNYRNLRELISSLDGLLLTGGGGDVGPGRYGDTTVHRLTVGVHDRRDELELALVRAAIDRDVPFLSICRGSQILNVAHGGALYQDIPDQHGRDVEHRQGTVGLDFSEPIHDVLVAPGSLLERVYGTSIIQVNSDHHQASKIVGAGLRWSGKAPDGVIEAVERPGSRFVLGIQWHPELMFRSHPEHLAPFRVLVDAADEYRESGLAWESVVDV